MTTDKNAPKLPATTPAKAPSPSTGSNVAVSGNRKTRRAIQKVLDARGAEVTLVPTDAVLDGLTSVAFSALRREIASQRNEGQALFHCGNCDAPVYLTVRHAASTGDGRGAHFAHYSGSGGDCAWRTPEVLHSPGALQFAGQQEGGLHQRLKASLAHSLSCDLKFSDVAVEQRIYDKEGNWRCPDVCAVFKGQKVVFELQLARPSLVTIIERSAFYNRAGITLVWVTSAEALAQLNTQAFKDLYFASGGRIFAIDAASCERSEETGTFHLRELSLEPCVQPPFALFNRWRDRIVGPEVILAPEAQRHADGQRSYATTLAEKLQAAAPGLTDRISSAAAARADLNLVAAEWSALAKLIGGRTLRQAIDDGLPAVLAWLQAVERLTSGTEASRDAAAKAVAARAAAIVAGRTGKHWVPFMEHVADEVPAVKAALSPELRTAMIRLKASPGKLHAFHAYHRHMLSALHPWLSFWLLAKAPHGTAPHMRVR